MKCLLFAALIAPAYDLVFTGTLLLFKIKLETYNELSRIEFECTPRCLKTEPISITRKFIENFEFVNNYKFSLNHLMLQKPHQIKLLSNIIKNNKPSLFTQKIY